MRKILALSSLILIAIFISCGKDEDPDPNPIVPVRYKNSIFSNVVSITDISYGSNVTYGGVTKTLKLDLYFPEGDTATHRPLLILLPGGSFHFPIDKSGYLLDEAKAIAKFGYAVAIINYRTYDGTDFPVSNLALKQIILQGMQDAKAAVRFFRMDAATTNNYKINTDKIFLGGHSAGSINALHAVYLDDISKADPDFQNIILSNGGLEGESGNAGYSSSVSGIINLAGALLDKNYITADGKPMKSVYGSADDIVPIDDGFFDDDPSITSIPLSGSQSLNTKARSLGVQSTAYVISGGDHISSALPACSSCLFEIAGFMYDLL